MNVNNNLEESVVQYNNNTNILYSNSDISAINEEPQIEKITTLFNQLSLDSPLVSERGLSENSFVSIEPTHSNTVDLYTLFKLLLFYTKEIGVEEGKAICLTHRFLLPLLNNPLFQKKTNLIHCMDTIDPVNIPKDLYQKFTDNSFILPSEQFYYTTWLKIKDIGVLFEKIIFPELKDNNTPPQTLIDIYAKDREQYAELFFQQINNYLKEHDALQSSLINCKSVKELFSKETKELIFNKKINKRPELQTLCKNSEIMELMENYLELARVIVQQVFPEYQIFDEPNEIPLLENITQTINPKKLKEVQIYFQFYICLFSEKIEALENLNISSSFLTKLPDELHYFTGLKSLKINRTSIKNFPQSLYSLSELEKLSLTNNLITTIPNDICNLNSLHSLILSGNKLKTLNPHLANLRHLKKLDISNNQFRTIPEVIYKCENLKNLNLRKNFLSNLDEEFGTLNHLQSLNLVENKFKVFPIALLNLENLSKLHLSQNKIKIIPNEIEALKKLTSLSINSCQLTDLPDNIGQLYNLRTLLCASNAIESIPASLNEISNLTDLNLNKNFLSKYELKKIFSISSLKYLSVSKNKINKISSNIQNLFQLESLNLSKNKIKAIPEEIGLLKRLKTLDLSKNKIDSIPQQLFCLNHLNILNLSNNEISKLPDTIHKSTRLVSLDISDNFLLSIPSALTYLPYLKQLDLRENFIKKTNFMIKMFNEKVNIITSDY